ncbi:MAG: cupin domain-containing protein [Anaerolineales bacterium]|nr:cupin domain-containing protein [Anaerolineales bacterium]
MSNRDLQADPYDCPHQRRRRRRRDFLDGLRQSQDTSRLPIVEVGQRLREKRAECGLTIRDLAKKSGLNVNTLSMIENGKASPSVATLQQLSFALEMPIAAFFEESIPKRQIAHYKASQRPVIAFAHGMLEDLGAGMSRRGAETFLVTLNPYSNSGEDPIVHTGRETVFCLEGQLTCTVDNQTFVLGPGDSLLFEAHLPHCLQNTGAVPTRSLLVLCPTDEQDRPTERHFALEMPRNEEA